MAASKSGRRIIEAVDVDFGYGSKDFRLSGINLEVRSGRSLAIVGFNGQGKSTLCKVLGKVKTGYTPVPQPESGHVFWYPNGSIERIDVYASILWRREMTLGFILLALAFKSSFLITCIVSALCIGLHYAWRLYRDYRYSSRVVYITTENEACKVNLRDEWNLTDAITSHLRYTLTYLERQALTERLLTWSGFSYQVSGNDDSLQAIEELVYTKNQITCGVLSGGQRHLIYLLRALAPLYALSAQKKLSFFASVFMPRVDLLLLDEAFNCLDTQIRPRAIRLVRHAVVQHGVACVIVNQILHEVAVLCDDAIFLDNGEVVQSLMPAIDMIANSTPIPQVHPRCREYVFEYWALERDMRQAAGRDDEKSRPCGADLQDSIDSLPELLFLGPPWQHAKLNRGDRVKIVGLQSQRRFNGKNATVLTALDAHCGRFKVRLHDSQTLSVRRANLDLLPPSAKQEEASSPST